MGTNLKSLISRSLVTVLAVDLLAASGDITLTWTSPMFSKFYSNDTSINPLSQPITKRQDAMIASSITIGAAIGGIPFSYIADGYGRKSALLIMGAFHIIAYLTMAFATIVELFYFGRIFGGLAVGGGYTLLPLYIAEVAEETKRGAYSVTLATFWGLGNFLPYLIGPYLSVKIFNLINFCFPLAFFIVFYLVGTETPFYLVGAKKIDQAEKVLMLLRSKDSKGVQDELQYIKDSLAQEEQSGNFKIIFTNAGIRKAFIISISLMILSQLSGWNAITFYLQPIFEASGTDLSSEISSIIVGAAIFGSSLFSPYFADKFGRKTLLIFSNAMVGLCLILLGGFFFIQQRTHMSTKAISWIPITSLIVLTFSFQVGIACIPWTISSEIFPKNIKKLAASATSGSCWFMSFLVTQFFNDMIDGLGTDGTLFLFAAFTFIAVIFTVWYVPETRRRTFIEIQQMLQK